MQKACLTVLLPPAPQLALFFPSIFFQLTGALVWNIWFSSETQDFDALAEQAK